MHIRRFPMRAVLEHMCETFSVVKVPTLLVHDAGPVGIFDFNAGTVSYRSDLPIEQIIRTLAHVLSQEKTAQISAALYMTLHGDRWIEEFRGK